MTMLSEDLSHSLWKLTEQDELVQITRYDLPLDTDPSQKRHLRSSMKVQVDTFQVDGQMEIVI